MGIEVTKKRVTLLGLVSLTVAGIFACGGGGESSTSSTSTSTGETTLVTGINGSSNAVCGTDVQCIGTLFRFVASMPATLSVTSTSWTNTSTNIITISQIPFVDGSNSATVYDSQGSIFETFTNEATIIPGYSTAGTRYFFGNGLPTTPMGTFPVQSGTAAYSYYAALPGGTNPATGQTYTNSSEIGISPYPLISSVPLNPVATGFYPIESLIVGITLTGAA